MSASTVQVLCPNGRRQNVKVAPSTTMLQVLEEVCKKQGFLPPEDFNLKHGRNNVDLTLPFRFGNLSNNAKLELVKATKTRAETKVLIGLQLDTGERLQAEFSPVTSIWDVLVHWKKQDLSDFQAGNLLHPVCTYLREEIIGEEELKFKTLKSLGLTGGKAIIRLVFRKIEDETLATISQRLEEERLRQEKLDKLSSNIVKTDTKTKDKPQIVAAKNNPGIKSSDTSVTCNVETVSAISSTSECSMDTGSSHSIEPMDTDTEAKVAKINENSSTANNSSPSLDSLNSIPGVQVIRPGAPVNLSSSERRMVNEICQQIKPQIQQSRSKPTPQPAPFKFPEATKGMDLYRNELSAVSKEDFTPCERETILYSLDSTSHEQEALEEPNDEFFEVTQRDLQIMMRELQVKLLEENDQPLLTQAMKLAQKEAKLARYEKAVIRIQFPDRLVLQGLFRLNETVYNVKKFVKQHLHNKSDAFYLYTTPPRCVLTENSKTLVEANLVPASVLHFGSDQRIDGQILSDEYLNKVSNQHIADEVALKCMHSTSRQSSISSKRSLKSPDKPKSGTLPASATSSNTSDGEKKLPKWLKLSK